MKLAVTLCCIAMALSAVVGAEPLPLAEFVGRARNPNAAATYAALSGQIQHQRRGQPLKTVPIYFAVILQPERMTGQIILDGKEGYLIGQRRNGVSDSDSGTSVVAMPGNPEGSDELGWMGVRASDLTLSFLYYPVLRELGEENVSILPCRVVLFEAPDKSELVKVYISRDHGFPLKAEFFRPEELEKEPFRTLETSGFTKKNELYFVKTIKVSGPGWRTRVEFDTVDALIGLFNPASPPRIIRALDTAEKEQ